MIAVRRDVPLAHGPVSYLEWTPATAARGTVVLLHGGGVDSAQLTWGPIGPEIAEAGWRVLAPDAPGYGESPLPQWPSTQANLLRYVGEFVEALGLDRVVLGGLSMGGGLTWGYALAHPDHVEALIACGAHGMSRFQWQGRGAGLLHKVTWASVHSGLLGALNRLFTRSDRLTRLSMRNLVILPGRNTDELFRAIREESRSATAAVAFGQWQRSEFTWRGLRSDYSDRFTEIHQPVLLVHGERDIGVPVDSALRTATMLPDAEVFVVPGAAHWVTRDAPDAVIATIIGFLDRRTA